MNKKTQLILFLTLVLILAVMCSVSLNIKADEIYPITYKVTASTLNVRYAPGIQYETFYQLKAGEEVNGKEFEDGWAEINCYGFKGYVWSGYIRNVDAPQYSPSINGSGNLTYYGKCWVTGYDICYDCCRKTDGITASGTKATVGRTVAMGGVPFGAQVYIKGIGCRVVEDRGVSGNKVDVLCNNHSECYAITGWYDVYIVN